MCMCVCYIDDILRINSKHKWVKDTTTSKV